MFQVREQGRDGLVDLGGEPAVVGLDFVMVVPWLAFSMPQLNVANATFQESPGDQGLASVDLRSVTLPDVFRFL